MQVMNMCSAHLSVLDKVYPGKLRRKKNNKTSKFFLSDNLTNLLESAREIGITENDLLDKKDLQKGRNIGKVLRTLGIRMSRTENVCSGIAKNIRKSKKIEPQLLFVQTLLRNKT